MLQTLLLTDGESLYIMVMPPAVRYQNQDAEAWKTQTSSIDTGSMRKKKSVPRKRLEEDVEVAASRRAPMHVTHKCYTYLNTME